MAVLAQAPHLACVGARMRTTKMDTPQKPRVDVWIHDPCLHSGIPKPSHSEQICPWPMGLQTSQSLKGLTSASFSVSPQMQAVWENFGDPDRTQRKRKLKPVLS